MLNQVNANQSSSQTSIKTRHRTTPIAESISHVPGYPTKLTLYQIEASPYWWVRYYVGGKILRRSTKTDSKRDANAFAKKFYTEIELKRSQGEALTSSTSFRKCADGLMASMKAQVARKEITQMTCDNAEYRLNKSVMPHFGSKDVNDIAYSDLESYLNGLSYLTPPLSTSTINSYMKLVKRVFSHAAKNRLLNHMPVFPTVKEDGNARGYFTTEEYDKLWRTAQKLAGKRFEYRKISEEDKGSYYEQGTCKDGRRIRTTEITAELRELIVFMVNSFVRPADIRQLKHKHVEIVQKGGTRYLRLTLPPSKKHDYPIATMPKAVDVYERLKKHNEDMGRAVDGDAYVFFPNYTNRSYALKQLQRQIEILLWYLDMAEDRLGNKRAMYSLRHSSIMFRLLNGENIDLLTLARNARTSVEMIEDTYASQLTGEQNIDMLHSDRRRNKAA